MASEMTRPPRCARCKKFVLRGAQTCVYCDGGITRFRPASSAKGHPLVKDLIRIANRKQVPLDELARLAGVGKGTIISWRRHYNPTIDKLEACFNVVGYTLVPKAVEE